MAQLRSHMDQWMQRISSRIGGLEQPLCISQSSASALSARVPTLTRQALRSPGNGGDPSLSSPLSETPAAVTRPARLHSHLLLGKTTRRSAPRLPAPRRRQPPSSYASAHHPLGALGALGFFEEHKGDDSTGLGRANAQDAQRARSRSVSSRSPVMSKRPPARMHALGPSALRFQMTAGAKETHTMLCTASFTTSVTSTASLPLLAFKPNGQPRSGALSTSPPTIPFPYISARISTTAAGRQRAPQMPRDHGDASLSMQLSEPPATRRASQRLIRLDLRENPHARFLGAALLCRTRTRYQYRAGPRERSGRTAPPAGSLCSQPSPVTSSPSISPSVASARDIGLIDAAGTSASTSPSARARALNHMSHRSSDSRTSVTALSPHP
ncbi:hypothetical protein V8E36_008812 [Tilletia maclaganii]